MTRSSWKAIALALLFAICSLLGWWAIEGRRSASFNAASVVTQVERLSELVTVRYRVQRAVGIKEAKEPVGEESILLMVEGEVLAGVDLRKVSEEDVKFSSEKAATISLPPAAIFNAFLDEKQTRVWDRHITWWTPWVPYDPDLEHKARLKGIEDIREAALGMGILKQADSDAQTALKQFFGAAGFNVSVKTRGLD